MTTEKTFNVRFRWSPFVPASDSHVYHEEYESSITVRALDYVQAEKKALEVVRTRFPEYMRKPGWSGRPWTHAVTRKVADEA